MRTLNIIKLSMAGVLCMGLISACSDRFGAMKPRKYTQEDYLKARKMTPEQYNEWARQNGKPLIRTPLPPPNQNGQRPVPPDLTPTTPNSLPNPIPPSTNPPKPGDTPKTEPGTQSGTEPGATPKTEQDTTPATDPVTKPGDKAGVVPANCGAAPAAEAMYPKKFWACEFQRLMKQEQSPEVKKALAEVFRGISIGSGKVGEESVFNLGAVLKFGEQFRIISTKQAVKHDESEVAKLPFEARAEEGGTPDAEVGDLLFVSATCLSNQSPCPEFGVIVDVKVMDNGKEGRLLGVFQVKTGLNHENDPTITGIAATNVTDNVQNLPALVKGQAEMPAKVAPAPGLSGGAGISGGADATPATPTPTTVTPGDGLTAAQALEASTGLSSKIIEQSAVAVKAKTAAIAASTQKPNCDSAKANAEAEKAEAALTLIDEALPMLMSSTEQLIAKVNTQKEKDAADKMLGDSRVATVTAKAAASDARDAASSCKVAEATPQVGSTPAPAVPSTKPNLQPNDTVDPEGDADIMQKQPGDR